MCLAGKKALEKHAYRQALRRFEAVRRLGKWTMTPFLNRKQMLSTFLCDYADVLRNCGQHHRALEAFREGTGIIAR